MSHIATDEANLLLALPAYFLSFRPSLARVFRVIESFGRPLLPCGILAIGLTLTLACGGGSDQAPPPNISSFTVAPGSITRGDTAQLSGTFSNGTGTVTPGDLALSSGGSLTVGPTATTVYTLSVKGAGGNTSSQATLTVVEPPSISAFAASPAMITAGGSTVLSFAFSGGLGVIDKGVGPVSRGMNAVVEPGTTTTYTLSVTNSLGVTRTQSVTVTVVEPPSISAFAATPPTITAGGSTVLSFAFSGGTGFIDKGLGPVTSGIDAIVRPGVTTTYSLIVTNSLGATRTQSVTVTVVAAPHISGFSAAQSPITIRTATTLTAIFSGGTGSVDQGVGGVISGVPASTGTLGTTTTFTLTVTNVAGASATAQVTVDIIGAPTITGFTAAKSPVTTGTATTLMAVFSGGAGTVDNGLGAVSTGIAISTGNLAATTTFTLTVTNAAGGTAMARVTVEVVAAPSITHFSAEKSTISEGTSTTLSAVFLGGKGNVDLGLGDVTSGVPVDTGNLVTTATYTLTVTNSAGTSVTATAVVTVLPVPSITQYSASPATITLGDKSNLKFTFTGGAGTIDQGVGSVASDGSFVVSPTTTTLYTLTVNNEAGASITATVTVTVVPPPSIASFAASATRFYMNQGNSLTADFSNGTGVLDPGGFSITSGTALHVTPGMTTRYVLTVTNAAGTSVSASLTAYPNNPVSSGAFNPLALMQDGTVWAWGYNGWGQLGNGTSILRHSSPVKVLLPADIVGTSAGRFHCLALKSDGTAWAWGENNLGQLGDGTTAYFQSTPVQVLGLSGVVALAGAGQHSLALKSDGTVWAWGENTFGQLGDGTVTHRRTPVQVVGLSDVVALGGGGVHSLALKADGTVWGWGGNSYGQLGEGAAEFRVPVQIKGMTGIVALAGGNGHGLALKSDGTVWAFGANVYGQLGDGTTTNRSTPVRVEGLTGVVALAAGSDHSLALTADGAVRAWGFNRYGQLGDLTRSYRPTPVVVEGLTNVLSLAGGELHSVAVKSDGTVWTWGSNMDGELGEGTPICRSLPAPSMLTNSDHFVAGGWHTLALDADGAVWAWGRNYRGEIGNGHYGDSSIPAQVNPLKGMISVAAGLTHSLALKSDGTVWTWGGNEFSQLGDGTTLSRPYPAQVGGLAGVAALAGGGGHCLALKSDGTVWAWGSSEFGQIGRESYGEQPLQVIGLTGIVSIAAGNEHSLAIKSDGTVWAFGVNWKGQLGVGSGTSLYRSTPVQVIGLTDVVSVATGGDHSLALKSDGTVWAWGYNFYYQLGDGTNMDRLSPVPVVGLTGVTAIAGGSYHSLALKADGTVWAWGGNRYGQVGDGTTNTCLAPVQVNGITGATKLAAGGLHSMALAGTTLWVWGDDYYGQLGLGRIFWSGLAKAVPSFSLW